MFEKKSSHVGDLLIYKMLSDNLRLQIVKILSSGEQCVGDLVRKTCHSQSLISHKLKDLRETGLVTSHYSGKRIIYNLSDDSLKKLLKQGENTGNLISERCECVECTYKSDEFHSKDPV
ncbi:MAG: metalloregulator ArsR/SmtB family transcription factor [Thermoplasmataceae archaeon]